MKDFKNINEEIARLDNIYVKKVNKALFVFLTIAGVFLLFASPGVTNLYLVKILLFCIAVGLVLIGLIGLVKPIERFHYKATDEPLKKRIIYFDASDKDIVRAAIREGSGAVLESISNDSGNSMRAVVYATPSYSYSVSQIQTYVPHEYVPVEEPFICNTCRAN